MTTQIEGFTPQSNDELPVVTTTNISSAKQARKPPSSNNALDMYDEEDDRLCRNPTDDPSEDDDDQKNDIPDERPSKTKTPRALKMESLLKANDLMDLYEVLNDKNLGIDDLIEIEQDGVNEFCKEIGLSVTQKLKFKRLMRIIRSNQALQQTSSVNTKPSETQQQSDPGACTSTPIGIKECVVCTFHNPYTATICQMCGNSFVSGENDTPLTPGSQHQTFTPGVDDMKESEYGNVTASQKQTEAQPPTAGSLDSDVEDILKENGLYNDLHVILRETKYGLEDLKVMREKDVDDFCESSGLPLNKKLKLRRLINCKALHETPVKSTPHKPAVASAQIHETKQSEEDQFYAEAQAKKKSEKADRAAATSKPDDKMTVLLIGDTHAGKTSLFRNFIGDEFEAKQTSTIGIDSSITVEALNGTNMEVHVIDTAGQARWQAACRPYYKRADCIFVCFAIDDKDALENILFWREAIEEYAPDDVIVMLVGCKIDLIQATANDEDSIPTNREEKESKEFSKMNRKFANNMVKVAKWKQFDTTYFECSSRTGNSVEVLFLSAIQAVMELRNPKPKPQPNPQIRIQLVGKDWIKSSLMRNFTGNKFHPKHTANADDPNVTVATYSNSAHGKRIDVLDVCVSAISAKDKVSDCVFLCLPMDKPNVLDSVSRWSRQQDLIVILIGYLTQKSQNGSNLTSDVYQKNMYSAFQFAEQRNVSFLEYTSETFQVAERLFEYATQEVLRLRKDKLKKNRNDTQNNNQNRSRQKQNRSQNIVLHDPKYAMSNSTGKKKGKGKCCS
eukprot:444964_1